MAAIETTPLLRSRTGVEPEFAGEDVHKTSKVDWRRKFGIILALTGVFVAGADQSFVMVTYEMIASHFGDVSDSAWVLTGYNLGYCAALPVYGKMSDAYGRRIPLFTSYCLFSIGCIISGTGVLLWQVIAGRVISGLGGAGMVALVSVTITDNVLPNQVALMRSYVNIFKVAGHAFGGPIGGLITDAIGWRWSFIVQTPVALLCCLVCILLLSSGKQFENHVEVSNEQVQKPRGPHKIDYLGIGALTIMITSLLAAIEIFGKGKPEITAPIVLLGVAFCFGILFLLVEAYHAKEPLIPLSLLRTVSGIHFFVQMLLSLGRQAHVSSLAPYFIRTEGLNTTTAALHLVPSPIGFTVGSIVAGLIIQKTNKYKGLCVISSIIGALTYATITIQWGNEPYLWGSLYILPAGLGCGAVLACTFTALATNTPKPLQATAICIYYLCQQVGGIAGTGVSSVALHMMFKKILEDRLEGIPNKEEVIRGILKDSTSLKVPEALRTIVRVSYRRSFQLVSFLPCLATALALPLVLLTFQLEVD